MTTFPTTMLTCQRCGATYLGWHQCPANVQRVEISVVGLDQMAVTARQMGHEDVLAAIEPLLRRFEQFTDLPLADPAQDIAEEFRKAIAPFVRERAS